MIKVKEINAPSGEMIDSALHDKGGLSIEGVLDFDFDSYIYTQEVTGEGQEDVRMELEDWLDDALYNAGVDFYGMDTERTDGYEVRVVVYDHTGDITGKGTIQFNEI